MLYELILMALSENLTLMHIERIMKNLSPEQIAFLGKELDREDLQSLTVVRMGKEDFSKGDYDKALCRLRVDADKLRDEKELYALIQYYFN